MNDWDLRAVTMYVLPNLNFLYLYHILFSVIVILSFQAFSCSTMVSIYADPAVTAASKAFRDMVKEVYGDMYNNIPEGEEQSTLWAIGEICGNLINSPKFGPESAEFKAAEARYMEIIPAWSAFVNARDAEDAE
jgi:hypothetical protein